MPTSYSVTQQAQGTPVGRPLQAYATSNPSSTNNTPRSHGSGRYGAVPLAQTIIR
jgi:hypothetical protein